MNCFAGILNFLLYVVNIIFLVVGVLLIILASIMLAHINQFEGIEELMDTNAIPICVLILGLLVFIVSFFGCCGVWRQSSCLTGTVCVNVIEINIMNYLWILIMFALQYSVLMLILFLLQLVLTCWVAVNRERFLKDISNLVNTVWLEDTAANDYPMGALELTFDCCGDTNYMDYSIRNENVPGTCCGFTNRTATCSATIYESRPGCNAKFTEFWTNNTDIIRWAGLGICIYEFIVFFVSAILAHCMRKAAKEAAEE
ncbi:hypothetical protein KR222_006093 [Zaprionus bogoriensis]|nr:hypothetical protein KR222_006093 [Zaprionus bogoriensis]